MIEIRSELRPGDLLGAIGRLWEVSADKIRGVEAARNGREGSPVATVEGRYAARGWTEWTRGFHIGSAILQFDATGESAFLDLGRVRTLDEMTDHITHMGVHDHGFNVVGTYGNLWRLIEEGRIEPQKYEKQVYELALKASGAVQARRWTRIFDGRGYIYSFNGPHSLFVDTMRSLRSLAIAHLLGHILLEENDVRVMLLERLVQHAHVSAEFNVYYGEERDIYDIPGRVAQECMFNVVDGQYRGPSSQQGYSPFTTWTRGLSWMLLGCAEELEFLAQVPGDILQVLGGRRAVEHPILRAALATAEYYIAQCPTDGVPYWDTGAPGLARMRDPLARPADPFNGYEPVDSSAAAIAAQGLLRLGHYLGGWRVSADDAESSGERVSLRTSEHRAPGAPRHAPGRPSGERYWRAGLTVLATLLAHPYVSEDPEHQGLLLHAIYHRPNGWDWGSGHGGVPHGESTMWGDYHVREAALYVQRVARGEPYLAFFGRGASLSEEAGVRK